MTEVKLKLVASDTVSVTEGNLEQRFKYFKKTKNAAMQNFYLRFVLATLLALQNGSSSASDIWFSPRLDSPDFFNLFDPSSTWWASKPPVSVVAFSGYMLLQVGSASRLEIIRNFLAQKKLSLSVGILPLPGSDNKHCGYNIEGYSAPGQSMSDLIFLRKRRFNVQYAELDEPLYYGHAFSGKNSCHSPVDIVAEQVSGTVREMQRIYPHLIIGDVEPLGTGGEAWIGDIISWLDAFRARTGRNLGFFRVDINWKADWKNQLRKLAPELEKREIPLQVIFNGIDPVGSDKEWAEQALKNVVNYFTSNFPKPAAVVFEYWSEHPSKALPDSDFTTMTGIIKAYTKLRNNSTTH